MKHRALSPPRANCATPGLRAEAYVGTKKFGDQLKYADKRGAALAIIEGGDEIANGQVTIKNLAAGAEMSKAIESRAEYLGAASGPGNSRARRSRRHRRQDAGRMRWLRFRPLVRSNSTR